MAVKGRLFHRAQTVVQSVTMITGEEHLSEVMEGNRYPDIYKTASKPSTPAEPTEDSEAKNTCSLARLTEDMGQVCR